MFLIRRQVLGSTALTATATLAAPIVARAQGTPALTLQASWVDDVEFMGCFVGIDTGLCRAQGLNPRQLPGGPDVIPEASALSGKADISLTTVETATKAISGQKAPLVIIGARSRPRGPSKSPVRTTLLGRRVGPAWPGDVRHHRRCRT